MKTIEHLSEQVKTGMWKDRQVACELLSLLGDANAVHPLVYALDDQDVSVREAAYKALGRLNHPLAASPMVDHLEKETQDPVRIAAIHALGQLRASHAVDLLAKLLFDTNSKIRIAAAHALGLIRDLRASDDLVSSLVDDNLYVRATACESLGHLGNTEIKSHIIQLLGDIAPLVREKALESLSRLGDSRLVQAYSDIFFGDDSHTAGLRSLARMGDVRLISALIMRLVHPQTLPAQRDIIEKALGSVYEVAAGNLQSPYCLQDFKRFIPFAEQYPDLGTIRYTACRVCGSTTHSTPAPTVIAVLDEGMQTPYASIDSMVRINALHQNLPFDFNHVEIGQAEEKLIVQFCLQLRNDTDPQRPVPPKKIVCQVQPDAQVSRNTLQILKQTFGVVKSAQ